MARNDLRSIILYSTMREETIISEIEKSINDILFGNEKGKVSADNRTIETWTFKSGIVLKPFNPLFD